MSDMRKTIKTIITIFLILVILFVVAFLFYLNWMVNASVGGSDKSKLFEVKQGESTFQIAQKLKDYNLVKSDWVFVLDVKIKSKALQSGYYNLSPNMTMSDIFKRISSGETNVTKVTIPEGYRTEQIAQVLAEKGAVHYDSFVQKAKKYEGKLFPDTYFLPDQISEDDIIKMMLDDFNQRTAGLNYTDEDLIIASIVEREAIKDEERPIIAGVYKNRMAISMKLEADPTVQYGKDDLELKDLSSEEKKDFHFWKPITKTDYQTIDSPFNTYIISGLPPAPICNPGIKSLEATINYTRHKYLYFLQNGGKIYPAETLEQHNKNRQNVLGVKTKNL